MTCRICHQTSHSGKLFDLLVRATGTGVSHHEDVVILVKSVQQSSCKLIIRLLPGIHNLFITLLLSDKTTLVVLGDTVYCILCILNHLRLLRRHGHIGNGYGHCRTGGIFVTHRFNGVQYLCCLGCSVGINYFFKDLFQLFLTNQEINLQQKGIFRIASVYKAQILRQNLVKQESSQCGMHISCDRSSVCQFLCAAHNDL